ncbi:MAG TPA: peptidase M16 [Bacteroidales bacterium]|nr:peptidase M16 [Bacteroidales bacterium]
MINRKGFLFTLSLLVLTGIQAISQPNWNTPVPVDPNVRYGKLENGLTYYIRRNTEPKQRAEFYIAQNVGAILEEDSQNGLAHFLEHMAFNGTKNFPGKGIISYFETVGVKFGYNINAFTSVDETVYYLSDVPTIREGIIDSALLVLHDWSHFISLLPEEIESERGVIREEWRTGRNAERRMYKQLMPVIYKGSKYAERDVIGDINVINNFKHQELVDYYNKWYRPDLQSIVIVGDIDVEQIETKVKSLFADIPAPVNPAPRPFYELPDNDEPLIGVATDPEARNAMVYLYFKSPATPKEDKTIEYFRNDMVRELISSMITSRLNELVQKPNPPFVFGASGYFNLVRTKDAFAFFAAPRPDNMLDGVKGIIREAERAKRFGFNASELDRAKSDYMRSLENQLTEKDKQKNEKYVWECIDHFLRGEPMPGIEFEFLFAQQIMPTISIDEINAVAKQLITDKNIIISLMAPQQEGMVVPTQEQLLAALQEVKAENVETYVDKVITKPLVEQVANPGKVKKEKPNNIFGTTEWILSNGVRVVVKQTDFKDDQVVVEAFSAGGTSLATIDELPSASMATEIVTSAGVGEFTSSDLEKLLAGKMVNVRPVIGEDYEGFSGEASPKDFETLLQLIYLYMTSPRADEENFNTYMGRMKAFMANAAADPRMAFRDSITVALANHNPRVMPLNLDYLKKVDFGKSIKFYKDRFADASDFTFVFTGNVSPVEIKPLVEKYLGALPTVKRKDVAKDNGVRPPKGKVENYFTKPMQTAKSSVFVGFTGEIDYTVMNDILADYLTSILRTRYLEEIREKEGGSYGVGVRVALRKFPVNSFVVQIQFDTDPKLRDKLIGIVYSEIEKIKNDGPLADDLNKTKEYMLKEFEQNQRENTYWTNVIRAKYEDGIDFNNNYAEMVKAVDVKAVKEFAGKVFGQGNVVEVVMTSESQE